LVTCVLAGAPGAGCGNEGLQALLLPQRSVTVVVENQTAFAALPTIRTGEGRNIVEDVFAGTRPVAGFGEGGAVAARQTDNFRLVCNGDLELVEMRGATFKSNGGITIGGTDQTVQLRRDVDFDCGDTIRVRFTGGIFSFRSSVEVEPGANVVMPNLLRPNILTQPVLTPARDDRSIGDILDELFD
jgi:hypothetical protein